MRYSSCEKIIFITILMMMIVINFCKIFNCVFLKTVFFELVPTIPARLLGRFAYFFYLNVQKTPGYGMTHDHYCKLIFNNVMTQLFTKNRRKKRKKNEKLHCLFIYEDIFIVKGHEIAIHMYFKIKFVSYISDHPQWRNRGHHF